MHYVLSYTYVDNIIERRTPYRADHLALAKSFTEQGKLQLVGVTGEPINGALLIFNVEDESEVKQFVEQDPYVANGLVTHWRIEPWNLVIGADLLA